MGQISLNAGYVCQLICALVTKHLFPLITQNLKIQIRRHHFAPSSWQVGAPPDHFLSDLHTRIGSPTSSYPSLHEYVIIIPYVFPSCTIVPCSIVGTSSHSATKYERIHDSENVTSQEIKI